MEETLRINSQFFYIADLINIKIAFTSWGSQKIIGVSPEQVDPSTFFPRAHPDDQERLNRAQTKLYKMGQGLFIDRKGIYVVSIQLREQNSKGDYINFFLQTYRFFSEAHNTVFTLLVATDLSAQKVSKDYYYIGNDPSTFRYPDETLLNDNHRFSHREVEVLRLIASGLGSEQIADKLFLSVNTVDTHRRNILKKTRKSSTNELLIELHQNGIL
jgi:DNA-binding CsgD family transcriptional regulator